MRDARVVLVVRQANEILPRRLLGVSHMVALLQTTYYLFQFQASSMAESNLEVGYALQAASVWVLFSRFI
jgi:hypothetical protein